MNRKIARAAKFVAAAVLVAAVAMCGVGSAHAQQWADKMFQATSHDFGAVPRAAKVEYRFVLKNIYRDEVHISGVRSSCGCTSPRVEKDTLKTYEQGAIVAEFNTRSFLGQHGAHLTVTIDRPMFAEVNLDVKGYIRTDVVVDPGLANFDTVDQGTVASRKISIEYAGGADWKILEVKPSAPYVGYSVKEIRREPGRAAYELNVQLADSAPVGYLRDQLVLVTNDQRTPELPIVVEARVAPELSVSPSPVTLGLLQPGQTVTKQLVIRAKRPFRVTNIEATTEGDFSFKVSDAAQQAHVVPMTFTAGTQPGKITQKIRVETDLGGQTSDVQVLGEIATPLAGK